MEDANQLRMARKWGKRLLSPSFREYEEAVAKHVLSTEADDGVRLRLYHYHVSRVHGMGHHIKQLSETVPEQSSWVNLDFCGFLDKPGVDEEEADGPGVGGFTIACEKCGGTNTTYTLKQTRSADEGMTCFAFCKDCRHSWRHE